jgi:hypothetical protein
MCARFPAGGTWRGQCRTLAGRSSALFLTENLANASSKAPPLIFFLG